MKYSKKCDCRTRLFWQTRVTLFEEPSTSCLDSSLPLFIGLPITLVEVIA